MWKIGVLHPDLGLGGAERLIVDATCALMLEGNRTEIFTGYYDRNRCFDETKHCKVTVLGEWIPRAIFGRFHALLAYIKMIYIATYLVIYKRDLDIVLCDQVSACIPVLRYGLPNCRVLFYCHFPDQLLTTRETLLKAFYRKPLDMFEEWSTSLADRIIVNSEFTASVVRKTFKSLKNRTLEVLYPCVRTNHGIFITGEENFTGIVGELKATFGESLARDRYVFLTLNRFERKKNIALAIEALHECLIGHESNEGGHLMKAHLIVAGGYDERLRDCVQYYEELKQLVDELKLGSRVTFVKSPNDCEKLYLIKMSDALIYTPENEHFGIVPLEAMVMGKPVIASASGGPLETVESGITGFLCNPNKEAFSKAMHKLMLEPQTGKTMGQKGYVRLRDNFSFDIFRNKLLLICSHGSTRG